MRTFALAALSGAASLMIGGVALLAVTTAAATLFAALSYWRTRGDDDPGITTEVALVVTVLAGALAVREPGLAAGLGVATAILLAARSPMHHFVSQVLTGAEVRDALVLAAASLVVLPLLPSQAMGPYEALNPRAIWVVVVLVLAISAAGHVAVRALGARFGLPLAGLASGFISSAATIGSMGARARATPPQLAAAVAGAVLSTVATLVQMTVVIAATSLSTLQVMAAPLAFAGLAAVAYGVIFTLLALRQPSSDGDDPGAAFSLPGALVFALGLSVILLVSAALRDRFGDVGALAAAAAAGLVDTHAAAISIASLVASGHMQAGDAALPILAAMSTNTLTKMVFAATSGDRRFAIRVIPGLALVAVAAWCGLLLHPGGL